MSDKLLMPVKGTSWTGLIVAIQPGKEGRFPYDKESTIRPLISGRVALMYPEREYETEQDKTNREVLIVKRVK